MKDGYTNLLRTILECDVLKDKVFDRTHAWLDLLLMANVETEDGLERGQCRVTCRGLAKRWNWSLGMVQRFMAKLEQEGMVLRQSDTPTDTVGGTLLTLLVDTKIVGDRYTHRYSRRYNFEKIEKNERKEGEERSKEETSKERIEETEKMGVRKTEFCSHLGILPKIGDFERDLSPEKAFEDLWEKYPRKQNKKDAKRHFLAAVKSGVSIQTISDGLDRFIEHLKNTGTESEFIPYGSSWFCQHRWEDVYEDRDPVTAVKNSKATSFSNGVMSHGKTDYESIFGEC